MKALVLGGTGFIGMNLARALVSGGHDVTATRRVRGNTLFARKLGATLVRAELDDEQALTAAMRGRDVVFQCAGHYPRYSLDRARELLVARERVRCTLRAAERAGVSRYVLTSSVATVGPPRAGQRCSDERDRVERRTLGCVYHAVKSAIEDEVLAAGRRGLDVVLVCPTAVFGELDVKAGTGFVIVALGRRKLPLYVEGKTNLVDADDLARALILAAERGRAGERYIIGGHNLQVSALLRQIAAILRVPFRSVRVPGPLAGWAATWAEQRALAGRAGQRPFLSRELVDVVRFGRWVDTSKARRELGIADATPLETTLQKACSWYRRHRYLPPERGVPLTGVPVAP